MKKISPYYLFLLLVIPYNTSAEIPSPLEGIAYLRALSSTSTTQEVTSASNFCVNLAKTFAFIDRDAAKIEERATPVHIPASIKSKLLFGNMDARKIESTSIQRVLLTELEKRAKTSEQKEALSLFIQKNKEALATRDARIAQILEESRNEASTILAIQKKDTAAALQTLNQSIALAKEKAKTTCTETSSSVYAVRLAKLTLKKDIDAANKTFRETITTIEKRGIPPVLKQKEKLQTNKAIAAYKDTVKNAALNLKEILQ